MKLTIADIARLAGTSPTAVSFVLNDKDRKRVSREKRRKILEVIAKHGYRPSTAAKGLSLRRSFRIGICIAGTFERYPIVGAASHHMLVNLSAQRLNESGYGVTVRQMDADFPATQLLDEEADAFLFMGFTPTALDRVLSFLCEHGIPAMGLQTRASSDMPSCSWVQGDPRGSFEAGTRCLLDQGLTRIAMLDIDLARVVNETAEKRRGYEQAMRSCGTDPLPLFGMAGSTALAAKQATRRLLAEVPDVEGVLLTDNLFASTVQTELEGRPVRIIGFGDEIFARLCEPRLSYLRLPVEEMATACAEHIIQWIEAPEEHTPLQRLLQCELVIQDT
ncbi:MAG: hypothetical protein AMK75_00215 [Planctomycetes bacterium SM23_65]|nr:MAG: hypothetical protein AMK75_00215 [Planctomycetes bacterium SM23_65]